MNGLLSCASPWQNDSQNCISRKRTPSIAMPRNKTIKNNKNNKLNQVLELEDVNTNSEEETIFEINQNQTEGFNTNSLQQIQNQKQNTLEKVQEDNQSRTARVQQLINTMHTENDGQNLANFNPLDTSSSESAGSYEKYIPVKPLYSMNEQPVIMSNPYSSYREIYNGDTTYNPGVNPNNSKNSTTNRISENYLMEKLNRMLYILEEQQYEPTKHITEEFILYTFLGVFVIYIVDSFSRAGKYIR